MAWPHSSVQPEHLLGALWGFAVSERLRAMSRTTTYDASWRYLSDDDLRRWLSFYRRRLLLFDEEHPDDEYRDESRAFLAMLVEDATAEDAKRDRCATLGVPRDRQRFGDDFLADLKRRVMLDELVRYQLGAELGKERGGKRQGPCPICRHGENCFTVYLSDPDDQHYYCFRCGARGDCYGAMMQANGGTFPQAVEMLAFEAGIALPAPPPPLARDETRYAALPGRAAE
jgi:hypothetical protein